MAKKKSDILTRILKKIKERENDPNYVKPKPVKLSVEFQLGQYVAEYILYHHLPTLSVDMIKTNNVIEVNESDTKKYKELDSTWWKKSLDKKKVGDKSSNDNEEWKELMKFSREMEIKYLPEKLECFTPKFDVENMDELKKGLRSTLWNSDLCHYSISKNDDIEIEEKVHEYAWCRMVTLTRSTKD